MATTPPAMQYVSPPTANLPRAVRLADVVPTGIRWLWPGRIPLGRLTLLVSDPGLGKSLLTLDIAARVSRAAPWPDEPKAEGGRGRAEGDSSADLPPSSVLLLTAEDDLADTIRPRLEALGADCEKILAVSNIPGENSADVPRAFALDRDLARLRNLLDAIPDCRLIIIDPISAYLGGTNEHANADIQSLLTALAALARERELAVLVVSHLRKKEGAAIYRTMGSLAFVAAARAVWVLSKDPADPRGLAHFAHSSEQNVPVPLSAGRSAIGSKRLFLPLKNNLAPDVAGLAYSIESNTANRTPVIHWSPDPIEITADSFVGASRPNGRPDDERQHAIRWLRERLSDGPRATRDLRQEADAHGIGYGTLRRAFRELGGEAVRKGPFPFGQWKWKLPGVDAQNPGGEFCAPTDFLDQFDDLFEPWMSPKMSTASPTDT